MSFIAACNSGSIVALVTPMFDDGAVDWDSLDGLLVTPYCNKPTQEGL